MVAQLSARIPRRLRPEGYPAHLEREVLGFKVRAVVPGDAPRLRAEFESTDTETLRMRFFVPSPHLTDTDFERLTTLDYKRRLAVTAWDGKTPVAIARYEPIDDTAAEVAFVVRHGYRNRGLGRALIDILSEAASSNGYVELRALYLAENAPAAASLAAAGFQPQDDNDGIVEAVRPLAGT